MIIRFAIKVEGTFYRQGHSENCALVSLILDTINPDFMTIIEHANHLYSVRHYPVRWLYMGNNLRRK